MLTAQDIQEKAFEKANKGYNMDQVDEFLDELAAAITSLNAENADLRNKMHMLVQKVDEYRQTEDSMRLALLSAQKLSAQIESEAKERAGSLVTEAQQRADSMVAEAQQRASRIHQEIDDSIGNEQAKLEEAKKATDRFFDHMRTVCQKQIEFYDKLSQMRLVGSDELAPEPEAAPAPVPAPSPAPTPVPAAPMRSRRAVQAELAAQQQESVPAPAPVPPQEEDVPQEDGDPTRYYAGQKPKKKKRSFDDFSFGDDI